MGVMLLLLDLQTVDKFFSFAFFYNSVDCVNLILFYVT